MFSFEREISKNKLYKVISVENSRRVTVKKKYLYYSCYQRNEKRRRRRLEQHEREEGKNSIYIIQRIWHQVSS